MAMRETGTGPDPGAVRVLAPTLLEYWAARRVVETTRPIWAGVRLDRWSGAHEGAVVVVCGLAGALAPHLAPGTVVIPEWVGLQDGSAMRCDGGLVAALGDAARALGFEPETGPLLTASSLVVGNDRDTWARRGFVAADMETGLLASQGLRVATVRVILDSPAIPLANAWLTPARAMWRPELWSELIWLARFAPAYAARAAAVLRAGLPRLVERE